MRTMTLAKHANTCLTMNNIVVFDFSPTLTASDGNGHTNSPHSLKQGVSLNEKPADELIPVDAYWENAGLKIRFIPYQTHQMLKVVFRYKFDDNKHDKNKATFELKFVVPGTIFQQKASLIINNARLKELREKNKVVKKDGKTCYYCEIADFSSDLVDAKLKEGDNIE